jgi:hypothetical protein
MPTKALKARDVWTWDFLADITTVGGTFRILALESVVEDERAFVTKSRSVIARRSGWLGVGGVQRG